jgi:hypothetical protein
MVVRPLLRPILRGITQRALFTGAALGVAACASILGYERATLDEGADAGGDSGMDAMEGSDGMAAKDAMPPGDAGPADADGGAAPDAPEPDGTGPDASENDAPSDDGGAADAADGTNDFADAPTGPSPMHAAHFDAEMALLPGGRVLIEGGSGAADDLGVTEIFDPATDSWSVTGSLALPVNDARLVRLPDGRLLLAGGWTTTSPNPPHATAVAQLYDPSTGQWTFTQPMNDRRSRFTLTVLVDGRVLALGGYQDGPAFNQFIALASAEVFDPKTGHWTSVSPIPLPPNTGIDSHGAVLLVDGQIFVVGGDTGMGNTVSSSKSCFLYDSQKDQWSSAGLSGNYYVDPLAIVLPSGKVLLAADVFGNAELYDPSLGKFQPAGNLAPIKFNAIGARLPDGDVVATDGLNVEHYTASSNTWTSKSPLSVNRGYRLGFLALTSGRALAAGGVVSMPLDSSEQIVDP